MLRESPPSVIARKRFGNQACMSLLCLKSQELCMRSRSSCGCSHCANALTGMVSQPAGCSWEKASDAIKPNQGLPWSFWRLWQESHSKYNSQGNIQKTELSVCVCVLCLSMQQEATTDCSPCWPVACRPGRSCFGRSNGSLGWKQLKTWTPT